MTTRWNAEAKQQRARKALELYERGVKTSAIAERLGVTRPSVIRMVVRAREERQQVAKDNAE